MEAGGPGGTHEPVDWPELYGLVVTATGLTPREVGQMRLRDLADLNHHWARNPPAHIAVDRVFRLLAAVHGVEVQETQQQHHAEVAPTKQSFLLSEVDARILVVSQGGG